MPPTPLLFERIAATGNHFDIWRAVAQAIPARSEEAGYDSITPLQQIAWSVWAASGVIGCDGFWDQDEFLDEWAAGFDALGIPEAAAAIRAAPVLMHLARAGDKAAERQCDQILQAFYDSNDKTERLIAEMIRANPSDAFADLEHIA